MNSYNDILNKHRLSLYWSSIDLRAAEQVGEEVADVTSGEVAAYYIDEGFNVLSCYMYSGYSSTNLVFRTCIVLGFLNCDRDIDVLYSYMDSYCSEEVDTKTFQINRRTLRSRIEYGMDLTLEDMTLEPKKFFWTIPFQNAKADIKRGIVYGYKNYSRAIETVETVEKEVNALMNCDKPVFITSGVISENTGYSTSTIKRLLHLWKDDIDGSNTAVWETHDYQVYKKTCSINKIEAAIQALSYIDKRISQRAVATEADLHYNTVGNLWEEKRVQKVLTDYNRVIL